MGFTLDVTYFGYGIGLVMIGYVVGMVVSIVYSIISRIGNV